MDSTEVTQLRWTRLAKYLMRRWRCPGWVDVDDVRQDLYVGHLLCAGRYDATRGVSFAKFVTWNSLDYAKKRIHKARGAVLHGVADRAPSHFEFSFAAATSTPHDEERLMETLVMEASQEDHVARLEAGVALRKGCESEAERFVVDALTASGGNLDGAALQLYARPGVRQKFRLAHEMNAVDMVDASAKKIARREREHVAGG